MILLVHMRAFTEGFRVTCQGSGMNPSFIEMNQAIVLQRTFIQSQGRRNIMLLKGWGQNNNQWQRGRGAQGRARCNGQRLLLQHPLFHTKRGMHQFTTNVECSITAGTQGSRRLGQCSHSALW